MKRVLTKMISFAEDGLSYYDGEPFTGVAYAEWPDGTLESESEYREGLPWGKSKSWHKDGNLFAECEMFQDALHGFAREWSANGQLISEIKAEYGIVLRERRWNEQGELLEDYELKETDSDFTQLLEYRKLYGA